MTSHGKGTVTAVQKMLGSSGISARSPANRLDYRAPERRVAVSGTRGFPKGSPRVGHESFEREEQVVGSSDRSLGIVFAAVFALIGVVPWTFGGVLRLWALAIGALFLALALLAPSLLAPLNRVWTKLGLLLHRVVSPVVLGIMFFLVITPLGLLMRVLGKRPLRLGFEREARSYWIERRPPGPPPASLGDQF